MIVYDDSVKTKRPAIFVQPDWKGVCLETVAQARAALAAVQYAAVLLDLHLPDLPGNEVLARLLADPVTKSIPVVVLSADATPGQVSRLLEQGARAYLTKPLDVKKILALLDEFLRIPEASL